jgi:hypothetical protein
MNRINLILALLFIFLNSLLSCKKDTNTGHNIYYTTPNSAPNINPPGLAINVCTVSTVTTFNNFNFNDIYAACGTQNYVDLYLNSNANYQSITYGFVTAYASGLSTTGIDFNGDSMSGFYCAQNAYLLGPAAFINLTSPAIWLYRSQGHTLTYTDTTSPPTVSAILSSDTISISSDFILQTSSPVSGDSVIFYIQGSKNSISKTLGSNTTSCAFTSSEVASLGKTTSAYPGLLQIAPYRIHSTFLNGINFYFIKEACFSKYVVLN